jgi:hypothetical protein
MSASDVKLQNEVSELKWLMSSDWNNHRSNLTYYHKPFPLRTGGSRHKRCKIEKSCMNSLPNSNHNLIQYNIHIIQYYTLASIIFAPNLLRPNSNERPRATIGQTLLTNWSRSNSRLPEPLCHGDQRPKKNVKLENHVLNQATKLQSNIESNMHISGFEENHKS